MNKIDEQLNELFAQIKEDEYDMAISTFEQILDNREQKLKNEIDILHKRIDKCAEKNTPLAKEDRTIKIDYYEELRKQFVNKYRKG